jgi:hypothetical protein
MRACVSVIELSKRCRSNDQIQYTVYQTSYPTHYQVIRPTTESTNRILPEGAPTFKCSRCGHVFRADTHADHKP